MVGSLGSHVQDTEEKLSSNDFYQESSEAKLYKISQGGYTGAATVTLTTGESSNQEHLETQTLVILQKIDYNAPEIQQAIHTATQDIQTYIQQTDISQSPSDPDYFEAIMHIANESIQQQWPTQDDVARIQQLQDILENQMQGEAPQESITVDQTTTENLGAVVCVNKAICLYRILELHGFTNIYLNEMPPQDGEEEGHTNVIATHPTQGTQQYDAGSSTRPPQLKETLSTAG